MKIRFDDEEHKKHRDYIREYLRLNPEKNRERVREWRKANPDRNKAGIAKWNVENPERRRLAVRRWHVEHPEANLMNRLIRNMLLSHDLKKVCKSRQYIGCSAGFLRGWLEAQFQPGMTWDNYGSVWVVDHIVPLKWWDIAHFPEHLMEASHYTNLQPMLKRENIIKGARFAG